MLKKITILILTCLFAMTALSGCTTEKSVKNMIEEALGRRYEEEFVCLDAWGNNNGSLTVDSYYGLCHPKDDENLLFEVLIDKSGLLRIDEYASTLASRMFCDEFDLYIADSLGEHYTYCHNYGRLEDYKTGQTIKKGEFTLEYFLTEYIQSKDRNQLHLYFSVCINISNKENIIYEKEYSELTEAMKKIYALGEHHGMDHTLEMELFFVPADVYQKCVEYFQKNAVIKSDFYNLLQENTISFEPPCLLKFNYKDKVFSLSQKEYAEKRKEIDNNVW